MVQIMHINSTIFSVLVLCFICCVEFGTSSQASTRKPNFASGRGGGISRPNIELASTPGDSHWFDEPPVLGPDPILSSEHENVNIDTSYVTQYAGDRHGKFWNYVSIFMSKYSNVCFRIKITQNFKVPFTYATKTDY